MSIDSSEYDASSTVLVITAPVEMIGPLAYSARCRQTLGVITELIATAQERVIISTPFLQLGAGTSTSIVNAALRAALLRGVRVELVSTAQSLSSLEIESLQQVHPGCLQVFQPIANKLDPKLLGSHAKFCVSDGIAAYVGSANFTGPGLAVHFELGVLVRGALAKQVEEFWILCQQLGQFVAIR